MDTEDKPDEKEFFVKEKMVRQSKGRGISTPKIEKGEEKLRGLEGEPVYVRYLGSVTTGDQPLNQPTRLEPHFLPGPLSKSLSTYSVCLRT